MNKDKLPKEYCIPIKLSRPAHNILQQLHRGQGDPLYALISRTVDLKETLMSEQELTYAIASVEELLDDVDLYDLDKEDTHTAENLLYMFKYVEDGSEPDHWGDDND